MNQRQLDRFVEIAKALAPTNRTDLRNHHVTFLIRQKKLVAIGINKPKTNSKNLKFNYRNKSNQFYGDKAYTHSELDCIVSSGKIDTSDCTFLNIRIDRNGELNNAFPCKGCFSLLKHTGFKHLYYSTSNKQINKYQDI